MTKRREEEVERIRIKDGEGGRSGEERKGRRGIGEEKRLKGENMK